MRSLRAESGDLVAEWDRHSADTRSVGHTSSTPAPGRHLGNFPQAFSRLALIEAAGRIILMERVEEIS